MKIHIANQPILNSITFAPSTILSTYVTKIIVLCLCSFRPWLLQFSPAWLFSVFLKQTTKSSKQHCSPCLESSQNLPYLSPCFSPLVVHWFMNIVQTCFSVLQLPQLYCSCLLDRTPEGLKTNPPAKLFIWYFHFPSVSMHSLGQISFSYAAPSVWKSPFQS